MAIVGVRRVQRDRVTQFVRADHLPDERLAGGVLERVVQPQDDREQTDLPEADHPGDGQQPEHQGLQAHRDLQHDHEPALVHPVGHHPAVGREEQDGQGLEGQHEAQVGAGVGEGEHQPGLRGHLHPGPGERD